jgi:CheY-specific phosphatase CheX
MDKPMMIDAMTASISEVLAQMFFLPIEIESPDSKTDSRTDSKTDSKEDAPVAQDEMTIAQIDFKGPFNGAFSIFIPAALAQTMAADFLGTLAEDVSVEQVEGTVMEMINMLAGNALSRYDHETPFDMQLPKLITSHQACQAAPPGAHRVALDIRTIESRITFELVSH